MEAADAKQRQAWGSGSEKTSRLVLILYDPLALLSEHPIDPVNLPEADESCLFFLCSLCGSSELRRAGVR